MEIIQNSLDQRKDGILFILTLFSCYIFGKNQEWISIFFIAPLSDIPKFYIKHLTMHKVHMHAGAIRQLLYCCVYVREIIHSLKIVDYLPVHTHKPNNN